MKKLAFALISLAMASSAFAQKDRCADVLSEGAFAKTLYQSNTTYRRMLDYYLSTLTYDQAKTDRKLTGNIPIGEAVLGAGFTENRLATHKATTNLTIAERIDFSNATSVGVQTGDSYVLNAWTNCMRGRGGFAATFESVNATTATLVLEWFPIAGIQSVQVNPAFTLPPGLHLTSGMEYLKQGKEIVAGTPARVQFKLDAATTPVALVLNLQHNAGSDAAYLPPRLRLDIEKRPFPFASSSCDTNPQIIQDALRHTGTVSKVYTYCSDVANGWVFSQDAGDWAVTPSVHVGSPLHLAVFHTANFVSQDRFQAQLGCSSSSDTDLRCLGQVALTEVRRRWVPITD
jgi:hypothetical protein